MDIKVVAVAFNNQVIDDLSKESTEQEVLADLAISYIAEQIGVKLSRKYTVCPSSIRYVHCFTV